MDTEQLKYPIGKFSMPEEFTPESINEFITVIENFPEQLKNAAGNLSDEQLNTSYRPGGWTIRQVVNHVADSHANSMIRFKLALTEENPTIKPYFEERWAELADTKTIPVAAALLMIEGIHGRWTALLKSMTAADFEKTFFHPESKRTWKLNQTLALYAWHSKHHLAHVYLVANTKK